MHRGRYEGRAWSFPCPPWAHHPSGTCVCSAIWKLSESSPLSFYGSFMTAAFLLPGHGVGPSLEWEFYDPPSERWGRLESRLGQVKGRQEKVRVIVSWGLTSNVVTKECNKGCGSYEPGTVNKNECVCIYVCVFIYICVYTYIYHHKSQKRKSDPFSKCYDGCSGREPEGACLWAELLPPTPNLCVEPLIPSSSEWPVCEWIWR